MKNVRDLRVDFREGAAKGIVHPFPKDPPCTKPVRLIKFSDHWNDEGHPAPDPLLLVVRAAITWSWRHGQKLLVASKEYHPGDSDGDDEVDDEGDDELSALSMEEFLE